jgi:hypothetical protein
MIYYVSTERFSSTIRRLLRYGGRELRGLIASLTYEELFFESSGPVGHYVFTDFDRLSRYEIECAAAFATALARTVPNARILNHPLRALERYPLLIALHKAGINDFTATRLEGGARPPRYPVFIRAEDGYGGPETDVLHDDDAFDAAITELGERGLPLRGRIAVGYNAERHPNGFYEKYGAFNIGGEIIPQHLMRGKSWVVKNHSSNFDWIEARSDDDIYSAPAVSDELDYVRDNPHRAELAEAFALARIDFGRADYGIVNGRVQIYEINTNPSFPKFGLVDGRSERRQIIKDRFLHALNAVNTPLVEGGRLRFAGARPRVHDVRVPRRRLPISLARRALDLVYGQRDCRNAKQA